MIGVENGVRFQIVDNYGNVEREFHSYFDLGLILRSVPVAEQPEPYINMIDIPGRDKPLDFTTALDGMVHYKSRPVKMEFMKLCDRSEFIGGIGDIVNAVHGKKCNVFIDDDPLWYFSGRCVCGEPSFKNHAFYITVTMTADPYKYSMYTTSDNVPYGIDAFGDGIRREYGTPTAVGLHIYTGSNTPVAITLIGTNVTVRPKISIQFVGSGAVEMHNVTHGGFMAENVDVSRKEYPELLIYPGTNVIHAYGYSAEEAGYQARVKFEFRGLKL